MNEKKKTKIIFLCFLFLSILITIVPILSSKELGIVRVNDFNFHASRVESMVNLWKSPTNFHFFHQYGVPTNYCYPWWTLVPWFLFYIITHKIVLSYFCFIGLLTLITLCTCYYVALKITNKQGIGIIFAIFYSFSFYRLYNIFYRFAIGETIAMTFLPILLYALYKILYKKENQYWFLLTITMTLTAYTHLLSLLFYTIFLVLFYIGAMFIGQVHIKEWWSLIKAGFWSGILSLGSLIPMIVMSAQHQLFTPEKGDVYERALTGEDFIFSHLELVFKSNHYTIGIFLFLCLFIVCWRWKDYNWWGKELIIFSILGLIGTTKLIPWDKIQPTILGSIQFPWRLLVFPTCFISLLIAISFYNLLSRKNFYIMVSVLYLMVNIATIVEYYSITANKNIFYTFHSEKVIQDSLVNKSEWVGSGQTDYYLDKSISYYKNFENHKVYIDHHFKKVTPKVANSQILFTIPSNKEQEVILPVGAYNYMHVWVNGKPTSWEEGYTGGIKVKLLKGNQKILVKAKNPIWYLPLQIFSFISILGFAIFNVKKIKKECVKN